MHAGGRIIYVIYCVMEPCVVLKVQALCNFFPCMLMPVCLCNDLAERPFLRPSKIIPTHASFPYNGKKPFHSSVNYAMNHSLQT